MNLVGINHGGMTYR